ncbi:MAG: hypothetical protein ACI353_01660 [Alloprevotella sp.]
MKSSHDIDTLLERYYAAQTTEEEERTLLQLLTADPETARTYEADLAVRTFLLMGRRQSRRKAVRRRRSVLLRRYVSLAAAAIVAVVFTLTIFRPAAATPDAALCEVYIGGRLQTDSEAALRSMKSALQATLTPTAAPTVEQQLRSVFALPPAGD